MKLELSNNKDFLAGIMFIGIGAAAMIASRNYEFGSALLMGPGFFPTVIGGILIVFGICIMAIGLHRNEKITMRLSLRPMIMVTLSLVFFGLLMRYSGFLPALTTLIFGSAAAGRKFDFTKVMLITSLLILFALAVFIWGLNLPYRLI